jgi:hypothetical protein
MLFREDAAILPTVHEWLRAFRDVEHMFGICRTSECQEPKDLKFAVLEDSLFCSCW